MKLRAILNEATLPKPKGEKHNDLYHQKKPVQFKKPPEGPDVDEEPDAEKDQQDVLDRMDTQAEISTPSSTEFFTKLRDNFQTAIKKVNDESSEKNRADKC